MKIPTIFLALTALTTASLNTTQMYKLVTKVKGNPPGKNGFNDLYLQGYHIGAGLSDVTLTTNRTQGINGFLNATNQTIPQTYTGPSQISNALFDFGNPFPWGLEMVPYETFYTIWQPVEVNAGVGGNAYTVSGFFINDTGLQWTSSPERIGGAGDEFGGWLVCDWWHGVVQLFFRLGGRAGGRYTPSSCADVWLVPEYF